METKKEHKKVIYTGAVPQCPYCEKPTQRSGGGYEVVTAMYFEPTYDEKGNNINPDRNSRTSSWHCSECKNDYVVTGNHADGFYYRDF